MVVMLGKVTYLQRKPSALGKGCRLGHGSQRLTLAADALKTACDVDDRRDPRMAPSWASPTDFSTTATAQGHEHGMVLCGCLRARGGSEPTQTRSPCTPQHFAQLKVRHQGKDKFSPSSYLHQ